MTKITKMRLMNVIITLSISGIFMFAIINDWVKNGCGIESILAAFFFYFFIAILLILVIDNWIRNLFKNE